MSKMESYNLTDNAISHIARLLQMGILTGTDIIDHLRTARFCIGKNNSLEVHPDYGETFNENVDRMLAEANDLANTPEGSGDAE